MTDDTQATLLLCASFGAKRSIEPKPLTPTEHAKLADWLQQHGLQVANLLDLDLMQRYGTELPFPASRLLSLLQRKKELADAIKQWNDLDIWVLSLSDEHYPRRLISRLKHGAPPLLYGAGNRELIDAGGLAVVGSRNTDQQALQWTQELARTCAVENINIVSGDARGVDTTAIQACLMTEGSAISVVAHGLTVALRSAEYRHWLLDDTLLLLSPYDPQSRWSVGVAMGRNKFIYGLADWGLVVHSGYERGGTWAGAVEALRQQTISIYVRIADDSPMGNHKLLERGALEWSDDALDNLRAVLINGLHRGR